MAGNCRKRPELLKTGGNDHNFVLDQKIYFNFFCSIRELTTKNIIRCWKLPKNGHNFVLDRDIDFNFFIGLQNLPQNIRSRQKSAKMAGNHKILLEIRRRFQLEISWKTAITLYWIEILSFVYHILEITTRNQ